MQNVYQSGIGGREPVPDDVKVTFEYRDDRKRKYTDWFDLSATRLKDQTTSEPSGSSDDQIRRRVARALEAMARGIGRP